MDCIAANDEWSRPRRQDKYRACNKMGIIVWNVKDMPKQYSCNEHAVGHSAVSIVLKQAENACDTAFAATIDASLAIHSNIYSSSTHCCQMIAIPLASTCCWQLSLSTSITASLVHCDGQMLSTTGLKAPCGLPEFLCPLSCVFLGEA